MPLAWLPAAPGALPCWGSMPCFHIGMKAFFIRGESGFCALLPGLKAGSQACVSCAQGLCWWPVRMGGSHPHTSSPWGAWPGVPVPCGHPNQQVTHEWGLVRFWSELFGGQEWEHRIDFSNDAFLRFPKLFWILPCQQVSGRAQSGVWEQERNNCLW